MAPVLPFSLSPHICTLTSPDLVELLDKCSLPPLPDILQCFSPLPQVTTRTTTLVSVPHASFSLRFSDLREIEEAAREDEEQRAIRTIDWITSRISKRCAKWVQDINNKDDLQTPWWDELRKCVEADFVPAKTESWNHPAALIYAVSTTAPNPLQAITTLHSRNIQLPQWVDNNLLKYTLIVHPKHSPLSNEEAGALFNAVKKQFSLHSFLLCLNVPTTPPPPVPVPALLPRLPPAPSPDSPPHEHSTPVILNALKMEEADIQTTARFTREFVVMSLVPWMEKCVVEWNENFSSTRRLPSRIFSSTRRLFGSPSPSPMPVTPIPSSMSSLPSRAIPATVVGSHGPPPQQRRLAEFATILGDFKLAITVWEALRKESKGGSDILPILLSPSPAVLLHVQAALMSINPNMTDLLPNAQLRALLYAVRWETGMAMQDFSSHVLEGERWLVWAASNSEEAPSALLLAHAALLSTQKKARRRAALWYVLAASRLEKCGIKPLTMHFLRHARDLYGIRQPNELSPSFWDSEGKLTTEAEGLEDILSGIEHPLGRLLYTTGDVPGAVKLFLNLLRGSSSFKSISELQLHDSHALNSLADDKLYLDDFRVAFSHWKSIEPNHLIDADLCLPLKLCGSKQTRIRSAGETPHENNDVWSARLGDWNFFRNHHSGKDSVAGYGKIRTDEVFWVDLFVQNPLNAEINLSNVTLLVEENGVTDSLSVENVEVEVIKSIILGAKQSISIPIALKSSKPASIRITHAKYEFLSLLSTTESLASRGRRLYDTPSRRQQRTYATDDFLYASIVLADHQLLVSPFEDKTLFLMQGENKSTMLSLRNTGICPVGEVWMVVGPDDEIWLADNGGYGQHMSSEGNVFESSNSLKPQNPRLINFQYPLLPGHSAEVPVILHAEQTGHHDLYFLFMSREDGSDSFHSTKFTWSYEVQPLFKIALVTEPSQPHFYEFTLDMDIMNISKNALANITQVTCVSPQWVCESIAKITSGIVEPFQRCRFVLGASPFPNTSGCQETLDFVSNNLSRVLQGGNVLSGSLPPRLKLRYSHLIKNSLNQGVVTNDFIESSRRKFVSTQLSQIHPYILSSNYPALFPLFNPASVDVFVYWKIPSQNISGHIGIHGITLGARHAKLEEIIEHTESAKVKRSMYAETRRENMEILESIRGSEWNVEMNPVIMSCKSIGITAHDFAASGSCHVPIEFQLRNYSLTHAAKYSLKLRSNPSSSEEHSNCPSYRGRITFHGNIPPSSSTSVEPKLWVTRPGAYNLGGWILETEICSATEANISSQFARIQKYVEEYSLSKGIYAIVCDSRSSVE